METSKSSLKGSAEITAIVLMGLAVVFLASSDIAFAREGKGGGPGAPVMRDRDNNPPGPRGGQGTNWEKNDYRRDFDNNPPGPRGGQGSNWEKNDFRRGDRDNNPPGPRGGEGTNWEKNDYRRDNDNNPPGPGGGPGSNWEKNDFQRGDRDNNPPGPRGGQGTNWEKNDYQKYGNPPGPREGSSVDQSGQNFPRGRERFQEFIEKNPDIEKKLDANGDGTVDELEKKQGYEKMLQERYGNERRDPRMRYNGNNEPAQNAPEAGTPK